MEECSIGRDDNVKSQILVCEVTLGRRHTFPVDLIKYLSKSMRWVTYPDVRKSLYLPPKLHRFKCDDFDDDVYQRKDIYLANFLFSH